MAIRGVRVHFRSPGSIIHRLTSRLDDLQVIAFMPLLSTIWPDEYQMPGSSSVSKIQRQILHSH